MLFMGETPKLIVRIIQNAQIHCEQNAGVLAWFKWLTLNIQTANHHALGTKKDDIPLWAGRCRGSNLELLVYFVSIPLEFRQSYRLFRLRFFVTFLSISRWNLGYNIEMGNVHLYPNPAHATYRSWWSHLIPFYIIYTGDTAYSTEVSQTKYFQTLLEAFNMAVQQKSQESCYTKSLGIWCVRHHNLDRIPEPVTGGVTVSYL
jgi:hypothetical protein